MKVKKEKENLINIIKCYEINLKEYLIKMKNSKFIEAYLNIIKEENEDVAVPMETPAPAEETAVGEGNEEQCVCFKTSDKNLIDAINSGFDEVVFFVKAKDEATGEDTVAEVKFGPDSFKDFEIKAVDGEGETCPECGNAECTCECGDVAGEEDEGGDNVATEEDEGGDTEGGDDVAAEEDEGGDSEGGDGVATEEGEIDMEEIDPSEWLEDGVCVKCGKPDCDGTCKCEKCGSQNCIGDCDETNANPKEEGTIGGAVGAIGGSL